MGCLKGKKKAKEKAGNFVCKKCGAIHEKKGKLCKPKEIKDKDEKKDKKGKS
jgi:DNA-directed RNA polymerase subunit M/transcription elongation factor TFIIS